jgi:hypothetical protein
MLLFFFCLLGHGTCTGLNICECETGYLADEKIGCKQIRSKACYQSVENFLSIVFLPHTCCTLGNTPAPVSSDALPYWIWILLVFNCFQFMLL